MTNHDDVQGDIIRLRAAYDEQHDDNSAAAAAYAVICAAVALSFGLGLLVGMWVL